MPRSSLCINKGDIQLNLIQITYFLFRYFFMQGLKKKKTGDRNLSLSVLLQLLLFDASV